MLFVNGNLGILCLQYGNVAESDKPVLIVRYLSREVFHTMMAILGILLIIVFSNVFVNLLTRAAAGSISSGTVLVFIGLLLPTYVALLCPISFYLAIVMAYGRLFSDNELLTCLACGMGWKQLMRITLVPAVILTVLVAILTYGVMPTLMYYRDNLDVSAHNKTSNISLIRPGEFVSLENGQDVIYIGHSDANKSSIGDVFLYRHVGKAKPIVVYAPTGKQSYNKKLKAHFVNLENGYSYQGTPGSLNYQIVRFKQYRFRLKTTPLIQNVNDIQAVSTWQLLKRHQRADWVELQWRSVMPLSVLILTIVALTLCYTKPRQGRYAKLLPTILMFIFYFNILTISHNWLQKGDLPIFPGMLLPYLVFLVPSIIVLWRFDGWHWFRKVKRLQIKD